MGSTVSRTPAVNCPPKTMAEEASCEFPIQGSPFASGVDTTTELGAELPDNHCRSGHLECRIEAEPDQCNGTGSKPGRDSDDGLDDVPSDRQVLEPEPATPKRHARLGGHPRSLVGG